MGKVAVDILIVIVADMKDPDKTSVRTNARQEALDELLTAWVQDQVGRGRDDRKPAVRDAYTIKIGYTLDDTFYTESDTGNEALTCGIVMDVIARIANGLRALPLS